MKKITRKQLKAVIDGTPAERHYLCEKHFGLFFAYYFVDYIKYPFADFHYEMFEDVHDLMNDKYREIAWIMFRESAKTSISKAFITWLICYEKKKYINTDSFDKENAERILFDVVVELQSNPRIKKDFGELFNSNRQNDMATVKRVNNFVTNNKIRVEAHSTQESVRGRIHGHQRPDFLLLDDFETNKTKDSEAYTSQVKKHIDEFKTGLGPAAKVIYLGNYITELGSVQTLMDRAKEDHRLLIRNVPVVKNEILAWPQKYAATDEEATKEGKVSLEDKKRQFGPSVYSAEMLNQPIDAESQEFFMNWFPPVELSEFTKVKTRKFVSIDTALSKHADSDYTGVIKCWVNEKNDWAVDAKRYRINSKALIDLIFQFHDDGFEQIGIETTSYTEAIQPFFKEECRIRNKYPYIVELKHGGMMKESRIRGLIPKYSAGDIYHIKGECADLEEELIRFPRSVHDDVSDALAYMLKLAKPPYEGQSKEIPVNDEAMYKSIGI